MQTQLERAALGRVRATENYSFQPVHKAPRKSLEKTPRWLAHCKLFTCCWQVCSQQQHTKITSNFSWMQILTVLLHRANLLMTVVCQSLTRTHLLRPGCCSLSSMSCCCGSLAAQWRNAWNVSVSRYFRDPSLGNACTSHRSSLAAHCPSGTVTVGSLFSPLSPTQIKIFSPAPLCEAKSSWEMKIPQINNIPVCFQTCCGSGYNLGRQAAFRGWSPP